MKKAGLIIGGIFAALVFAYGSIAGLVNQGLSLLGAVLIFGALVFGSIGMVKLLGAPPESSDDSKKKPG